MTDSAATLAYYAMMSLFPALLVAITLLGLLGDQTTAQKAASYIERHGADPTTAKAINNALTSMVKAANGTVGAALAVSVVLGLNGASGAFGAAGRAINRVYGVEEDRGFVRRKVNDMAMTLAIILLFAVLLIAMFLGGGIARDLFGTIGLGSTAASVWSVVRWPVGIGAALLVYALIYAYSPDLRPPLFRWISPGAVVGVIVWILASVGFVVYIRNFSHYGAAYGAFGAAIVLLLWLWITNIALLFGAELNAELDQSTSQPK
jgi:membrane protein